MTDAASLAREIIEGQGYVVLPSLLTAARAPRSPIYRPPACLKARKTRAMFQSWRLTQTKTSFYPETWFYRKNQVSSFHLQSF